MFTKRKLKISAAIATDRAAQKIVRVIVFLQNGFAGFMNKRTAGFSKRTWKVLTVLFACMWGALSCYFAWNAMVEKPVFKKNNEQQIFIIKTMHTDSLQLLEKIYRQHSVNDKTKK